MKLTRRQLRKIINEAMKVPVFDKVTPEEIEALRMKARKEAGLEDLITPEKEEALGRDSAVSIYKTFGSEEPDMTLSQEDAFFAGQEQYEKNLAKENYPEIAELILSGGMEMVTGIKLAADSGALGEGIHISVRSKLQPSLSGITDVYVNIIIHDKEFASILNHKMGSGNFGEVYIDRGNNTSGSFGKDVIRGTGGYDSSEARVMRQNENNAGYKQIRYALKRQSIRYPLKITLRGDGTRASNIAQENTHNLVDNIT